MHVTTALPVDDWRSNLASDTRTLLPQVPTWTRVITATSEIPSSPHWGAFRKDGRAGSPAASRLSAPLDATVGIWIRMHSVRTPTSRKLPRFIPHDQRTLSLTRHDECGMRDQSGNLLRAVREEVNPHYRTMLPRSPQDQRRENHQATRHGIQSCTPASQMLGMYAGWNRRFRPRQ